MIYRAPAIPILAPVSCGLVYTPLDDYAATPIHDTSGSGPAWPTANKAWFHPVYFPTYAFIDRMSIFNGTVVSGNVDVGIYDASGTRLVSSGGVAQAGTSTIQNFSLSSTFIKPGWHYLAIVLDNTTGTISCYLSATITHSLAYGMLEQTSAYPLPATATMVQATTGHLWKMAAYSAEL